MTLIQNASRGVLWAGASQAGRLLIQVLALGVLSRLLPPADFGLLALATVVTTYASLLRDMGTAAAIIQRDNLTEELLDAVFWLNVCVGAGLACVLCAFSIPLANLLGQPRLSGILVALSISFPLVSIGAVPQALMERSFQFRALARLEISSALLAMGVACLAAIKGFGVYSLVLNSLVTVALTTLQLWMFSDWHPGFRCRARDLRTLWNFSANLFGFQTLNYFSRNADSLLIGRFLGAADLGVYNVGYRIMLFPLLNLSAVMSRSLFPILSRQQSDPASLGKTYLKTVSAIALITAPLMAGLWVLRVPFVLTVFGERWLPVVDVLGWLAPIGFIQSVLTTVGLVYMACGRTGLMMRWGALASAVTVLAMVLGLRWGYLGVARAYAAASVLLLYPAFVIPLRLISLRFTDVLSAVVRQILAAILMALTIYLLGQAIPYGLHPALRLAVLCVMGAATYGGLGCLIMRRQISEVVRALALRRQRTARRSDTEEVRL